MNIVDYVKNLLKNGSLTRGPKITTYKVEGRIYETLLDATEAQFENTPRLRRDEKSDPYRTLDCLLSDVALHRSKAWNGTADQSAFGAVRGVEDAYRIQYVLPGDIAVELDRKVQGTWKEERPGEHPAARDIAAIARVKHYGRVPGYIVQLLCRAGAVEHQGTKSAMRASEEDLYRQFPLTRTEAL